MHGLRITIKVIYLLTAVGLTPGSSSKVHIYTKIKDSKQTIHRSTQKLGRVRAVPHLCGFYPGIYFKTEGKSTGKPSVRVAV